MNGAPWDFVVSVTPMVCSFLQLLSWHSLRHAVWLCFISAVAMSTVPVALCWTVLESSGSCTFVCALLPIRLFGGCPSVPLSLAALAGRYWPHHWLCSGSVWSRVLPSFSLPTGVVKAVSSDFGGWFPTVRRPVWLEWCPLVRGTCLSRFISDRCLVLVRLPGLWPAVHLCRVLHSLTPLLVLVEEGEGAGAFQCTRSCSDPWPGVPGTSAYGAQLSFPVRRV